MRPYFVPDPAAYYGVAWVDGKGRKGIITRMFTPAGDDTWNIRQASSALVYVADAPTQWHGVMFGPADTDCLAGTA